MLLTGGAAGVLWLLASRSTWELTLAILATALACLGLYWMLAALIPLRPFRWVEVPAGGTGGRRVIKPMSRKEYERLTASHDGTAV